MGALFLAGNGFDIAHGIPSKYSDFRSHIINAFPEALELRDDIVYVEDFEDIDPCEFAAEILLNTMDKTAGENWCDFEDSLAYIDFNNKLPEVMHKAAETEEEDQEIMKHYLLYLDLLTSGFINCSKIWQDLFRVWIKDIQSQIDEGIFQSQESLKALFSRKDMLYITFNYTKTLEDLYGLKKVIHIHNRVGQKLIFGHDKESVMYNQFNYKESNGPHIHSTFLDDMVMSFKKDTVSPLKKYKDFFKMLDYSIDEVYSYGFGYGKADKIYIKKIINSISPNAVWFFTEYEATDHEMLRIKKVKLRNYGFKGSFGIYKG